MQVEALMTVRVGRKLVLPVQIENEIVNYCGLMDFFLANDKRYKKWLSIW
jgi:hypothetical protein